MVTGEQASEFANLWISAWNAHDLEAIMSHYADRVELTSPVAARLLGIATGKVIGKASVRTYFNRGLEAYPQLRFQLKEVLWGINSVVLYYTNHAGTHTAEFMEFSEDGKVIRVVANYSIPRAS
jgi:predicted ester cyclase